MPTHHVAVIVTVNDHLGASVEEHLLEGCGILQIAPRQDLRNERWMVNHDEAEHAPASKLPQNPAAFLNLLWAELARGDAWGSGYGRV